MRWFVVGVVASVAGMAYLATQVKRAREKLSARALVRSGGRSVAGLLDRAADRIDPGHTPGA